MTTIIIIKKKEGTKKNGEKKRIIKKLNRLQKRKSKKYPLVKASYKGYIINCHCNGFLYRHKWFKNE